MMKNKEETPIKPIIREKMLKLQYPRSWNLSKYKYFLKIRVAVFFVESWISRSVLYRVIVLTGSKLVLYQNDKTPKSQPEAFLDEGFLWNSSSGWLLGIFWFRYWTGGGNHPVPFCGSSVTESNFQAVLFLVVPSEYLSHWQKFTIAAMPTVCCRWKDDKIVCNNSGKLCEEFLNYGSSPTVLVFVHPCSHRSYELSQVSFAVLFVFLFLKAGCPNLKIPLFFYLESFVRSNKSHNILAHCLPDVFKYLQNIWLSFWGCKYNI